jgi:cysteinyl-tRNA synthetase
MVRVLSGLLLLFLCVCSTVSGQSPGGRGRRPCTDLAPPAPDSFSAATPAGTRWLFQLQKASPAAIAASAFDTVVMDYSKDGSEAARYGGDALAALKGGGARQVLAYLSIGEAEDYRYYFQRRWVSLLSRQPDGDAPCWLARRNPHWRGNYKVQYWSQEWQQVVLGYLDRIIEDGFDGVYLDIIDAYEYWSDPDNGEGFSLEQAEAAARMISLVKRVAYHARVVRQKTGFLIVPQNGERILDYDTGIGELQADDYLNTISGLGVEDLYYDQTRAVPAETTAYRKMALDLIRAAGKKVVVLDYVDDGSRPVRGVVGDFLKRARADGYVPYAARTDRSLDRINTFFGQP